MVTIINIPTQNLVSPDKVRDGQIAVIRKHPQLESIGQIVQRYGNVFIPIGEENIKRYDQLYKINSSVLLEILPKGTTIQL